MDAASGSTSMRVPLRSATPHMWQIGPFGVAIGSVMLRELPSAWEFIAPVVVTLVLLYLARNARAREARSLLGTSAVGLFAVAAFYGVVHEPWALLCVADPGKCNWGIDRVSSYVAGWVLLLTAPFLGGTLVGWETLRPESMTAQQFANLLWLPAAGVATGTVVVVSGWNWLLLGTMAAIVIGGYAHTINRRAVAWVIAIALLGGTLMFLALYGVSTAVGCVHRGSCGWSLAQTVSHWSGAMVLAGSTVLSAASMLVKHRT